MHAFLRESFSPTRAGDLETDIELRFPTHSAFCSIRNGELLFPQINEAALVIYFDSAEHAQRLFSGIDNVVEAFMNGQLRSNGHLIWVFQTFAAFSKTAQTSSPET